MNEHLQLKHTTYGSHFKFAFCAGLVLIIAGVVSILHAIHPNFMPSYAERKTLALARLARMKNAKRNNSEDKSSTNNL